MSGDAGKESTTVEVVKVEQHDHRLGRHMVHDERSRAFARNATVDRSTWRDRSIRVYDPIPNPNQPVGNCTGVSKCSQLNAAGNRVTGRVLNLKDSLAVYALNTVLDVFDGTFTYDPTTNTWGGDDTGSSGLASCKSAEQLGVGGEYRWLFGGADEVVQAIMAGEVISCGTWWYNDMFGASGGTFNGAPIVRPTNGMAGGHQYVVRGYSKSRDLVLGKCWWGSFKDFWISRVDLDSLLRDGGDAHYQVTGAAKDVVK